MSANEKLKTREFSRRGLLGIGLGIGAAALVGCGEEKTMARPPELPPQTPTPVESKAPERVPGTLTPEEQAIVDRIKRKSIEDAEKNETADNRMLSAVPYLKWLSRYFPTDMAQGAFFKDGKSIAAYNPIDLPLGLNSNGTDIMRQAAFLEGAVWGARKDLSVRTTTTLDKEGARRAAWATYPDTKNKVFLAMVEEIERTEKTAALDFAGVNHLEEQFIKCSNNYEKVDSEGTKRWMRDWMYESKQSDGKVRTLVDTREFHPLPALGVDETGAEAGIWSSNNLQFIDDK